jgi:hypothetical protein
MQDVLNTLTRSVDLDTVQVLSMSDRALRVLVSAPRLTFNGRIDADLVTVSIRDALSQNETYQIETEYSETPYTFVSIREKSHKGVS